MEFKALQLKADIVDKEQRIVSGYAAIFGNVDSYGDVIVKGAFADSIKRQGGEVPIVWNHNWDNPPLGHTIELVEDDTGLRYKASLADTERALEIIKLIQHETIKKTSFAFTTEEQHQQDNIRFIDKAEIFEISPVIWPANDKTTISLHAKAGVWGVGTTLQSLVDAREALDRAIRLGMGETLSFDVDATPELEAAFAAEMERFLNDFKG